MAQATAKNLQFSGISPAPQVEKLKPYPKPTAKAEDATMGNPTEGKVQLLEAALEKATSENFPASILATYKKEIAAAKAETAKAAKDPKEISFEALQKRVSNAQSAAAAALERHQAHVKALDEQVAQIQKIRENRVTDFAASQEAFAARLREDEKDLAQRAAAVAPQTAPQAAEVSKGIATALTDLNRHHPTVATELQPCPATTEPGMEKAMGSLWHFYSAALAGFTGIPSVTFDMVQVCPSIVHSLVGDKVWEGYWAEQHNVVQSSQYIPTTMHIVLQHVLKEKHQELSLLATAKETAAASYKAAEAAQARRRGNGDPF